MDTFQLREGDEYVELNNLLKIMGWVATGGEAKIRIEEEAVKVNGEIETRKRKKIHSGDVVVYEDYEVVVE